MTLDRDIRFSADAILETERAVREEIRKATRSITTAEAARARGDKIQEGTLRGHYHRLDVLRGVLDQLGAARRAIAARVIENTYADERGGDQ